MPTTKLVGMEKVPCGLLCVGLQSPCDGFWEWAVYSMSRSRGIAMSFSSLYTHVFENVYVTVWTLEQWLRWVFPPFCFSACFSSDAFLFKTVYVCFASKNEDFMVFSVFPVFRLSREGGFASALILNAKF